MHVGTGKTAKTAKMGNRSSSSSESEKPADQSVHVEYYRELYQELNTPDSTGGVADGKTFRVHMGVAYCEGKSLACTCLWRVKINRSKILRTCGCQFDL